MLNLINIARSKIGGYLAAGLAVLAVILKIYSKGKRDERRRAKIEDLENANEVRKKAADARNDGADGNDPGVLRDDINDILHSKRR